MTYNPKMNLFPKQPQHSIYTGHTCGRAVLTTQRNSNGSNEPVHLCGVGGEKTKQEVLGE